VDITAAALCWYTQQLLNVGTLSMSQQRCTTQAKTTKKSHFENLDALTFLLQLQTLE